MADLSFSEQDGILRSISDTPPNHYILKLQLFSLLEKNKIESYTSSDFEAGGYKWKLILHPNGNKNKGITDHISLYLSIADSKSLGPCWEVHAAFRLFLLDQNNDCYLTLRDTTENGRRFHGMKHEWGCDKFIPLSAFKDATNGYLVDDNCVFGAEVYVCSETTTGKGECLSLTKDAVANKNTWRVANFTSLTQECVDSEPFNADGHRWKIQLYPKGKGSGDGSHISLYLTLAEPEKLPPAYKIYAEYTLRIVDQLNIFNPQETAKNWFSASNSTSGWQAYFSRATLNAIMDLVKTKTCIVEAEVKVHAVVNTL